MQNIEMGVKKCVSYGSGFSHVAAFYTQTVHRIFLLATRSAVINVIVHCVRTKEREDGCILDRLRSWALISRLDGF